MVQKPIMGWTRTVLFVVLGLLGLIVLSGAWQVIGVVFLILGVINTAGLLWWPRKVRRS